MEKEAAKRTSTAIHETVKECWEEGGPSFEVYPGPGLKGTIGVISVKACVTLLEHGRVFDTVIDACGELFKELMAPRFPSVKNAYQFPACLWGELKKPSSGLLNRWLDNGLETALGHEVWFFPLNPCLDDRSDALHGTTRCCLNTMLHAKSGCSIIQCPHGTRSAVTNT